jgi:hypothetical protein
MFDLEKAISEWRRQMLAAGIKTAEVLDELEAHLREDVDRRVRSGEDIRQAFNQAAMRMGKAGALKSEFAKAGPMSHWFATKTCCFGLYVGGLAYSWFLLMGLVAVMRCDMSFPQRLLGLAAIMAGGLSFGCRRWLYGLLPVIPNKRARTAIQCSCLFAALAWLPVYTYAVLPQLNLTVGQLLVITLWSLCLPPTVLGLSQGMDEAVRRRLEPAKA